MGSLRSLLSSRKSKYCHGFDVGRSNINDCWFCLDWSTVSRDEEERARSEMNSVLEGMTHYESLSDIPEDCDFYTYNLWNEVEHFWDSAIPICNLKRWRKKKTQDGKS